MQLIDALRYYNACTPALTHFKNMNVKQAVKVCPRADWLLWIASRVIEDSFLSVTPVMQAKAALLHLITPVIPVTLRSVASRVYLYGEGLASDEALARARRVAQQQADTLRTTGHYHTDGYRIAQLCYIATCTEYYAHARLDITTVNIEGETRETLQREALNVCHQYLDSLILKYLKK